MFVVKPVRQKFVNFMPGQLWLTRSLFIIYMNICIWSWCMHILHTSCWKEIQPLIKSYIKINVLVKVLVPSTDRQELPRLPWIWEGLKKNIIVADACAPPPFQIHIFTTQNNLHLLTPFRKKIYLVANRGLTSTLPHLRTTTFFYALSKGSRKTNLKRGGGGGGRRWQKNFFFKCGFFLFFLF